MRSICWTWSAFPSWTVPWRVTYLPFSSWPPTGASLGTDLRPHFFFLQTFLCLWAGGKQFPVVHWTNCCEQSLQIWHQNPQITANCWTNISPLLKNSYTHYDRSNSVIAECKESTFLNSEHPSLKRVTVHHRFSGSADIELLVINHTLCHVLRRALIIEFIPLCVHFLNPQYPWHKLSEPSWHPHRPAGSPTHHRHLPLHRKRDQADPQDPVRACDHHPGLPHPPVSWKETKRDLFS